MNSMKLVFISDEQQAEFVFNLIAFLAFLASPLASNFWTQLASTRHFDPSSYRPSCLRKNDDIVRGLAVVDSVSRTVSIAKTVGNNAGLLVKYSSEYELLTVLRNFFMVVRLEVFSVRFKFCIGDLRGVN